MPQRGGGNPTAQFKDEFNHVRLEQGVSSARWKARFDSYWCKDRAVLGVVLEQLRALAQSIQLVRG
ncbi:hypothetical protein DMH17_15185 [Raoultella planticola]|nr:hypothetical protein [Raoultella planticola]